MTSARPPLVFDVQRFSIHDGPGIRTTVFLKGCPLRCAWCQNPESQARGPEVMHGEPVGRPMAAAAILDEVLRDRDYYAEDGGLTLSGGEPLLHEAFAAELLEGAKSAGLPTCVETCGHVTERALESALPHIDLLYFDLKHMDPDAHARLTGVSPRTILANAERLVAAGAPVEFRVPIVPGANDDRANIEQTGHFLRGLGQRRVRLVPYRAYYHDKEAALGRQPAIEVDASLADARVARAKAWLQERDMEVEVDG